MRALVLAWLLVTFAAWPAMAGLGDWPAGKVVFTDDEDLQAKFDGGDLGGGGGAPIIAWAAIPGAPSDPEQLYMVSDAVSECDVSAPGIPGVGALIRWDGSAWVPICESTFVATQSDPTLGFVDFESAHTHPFYLTKASLKSDRPSASGISWLGDFHSTPATDFNHLGMDPAGVDGVRLRIRDTFGTFVETSLEEDGYIQFNVTTDMNASNPPGATTYLVSSYDAGSIFLQAAGSFWDRFMGASNTAMSVTIPADELGLQEKETYTIAVNWYAGRRDFYIDGLNVLSTDRTGEAGSDMQRIYVGANRFTDNDPSSWGYRVSDFVLLTEPQQFVSTASLVFLGDSQTTRGCQDITLSNGYDFTQGGTRQGLPPLWAPITTGSTAASPGTSYGCGFRSVAGEDGGYVTPTTIAYDTSYVPTVIRHAANGGLLFSNNGNYAMNGKAAVTTNAPTIDDLIDRYIAAGLTPTHVVYALGTNDLASSSCAAANTTPALFDAAAKAHFTRLHGLGVQRVVATIPSSIAMDDTLYFPACDTRLDGYIAVQNQWEAWAQAQGFGRDFLVVVDLFTPFGGHNPNPDLFDGADLHYSAKGSHLFGKIVAAGLLR